MTEKLFHAGVTESRTLVIKYADQTTEVPMELANEALVSGVVGNKNWMLYRWDDLDTWMTEEELLAAIDYALDPKFDEAGAKALLRWVDGLETNGFF